MQSSQAGEEAVISSLKALGLTKYEALVYIALLKMPGATASAIHDSSGVPRASVYPVIDQLLEKGLVSVSHSSPKRFAPIPPADCVAKLTKRIEREATGAREALLRIYQERVSSQENGEELIWNVYGEENIKRRLVEILAGAKKTVRIIAQPTLLSSDIKNYIAGMPDGIEIEVVTPSWKGKKPKKIHIHEQKHFELPGELKKAKEMLAGGICIVDGTSVMVMIGSGGEDAVALFSESTGFVRFFTRYYDLIVEWTKKSETGKIC